MFPVVLTAGEPAGIGPDLILQIAQQYVLPHVVVIADKNLLQARAKLLNLSIDIIDYDSTQIPVLNQLKQIIVLHQPLTTECVPGRLNSANADYVLTMLKRAAQGCLNQEFSAVITGPVHKGIINDAGMKFSGHTEFFAEFTNTPHVVMLLATDNLRVALTTTHLPLRAVADALTPKLLVDTLQILHTGLNNYFSIAKPTILVCGLNPHAGENGHLGREEIDIIIPTLEQLRIQGIQLIGPVPADTAFTPYQLTKADAVLTMYHDQGLPVLKHIGFDHAVNITLGLPFIRTSVDHGTALELAGTGKANPNSLLAAIKKAHEIVKSKIT